MLPSEIKSSLSAEVKQTNKQVISQSAGFISSAFVLVAGLAWNDVIREVISAYVPSTGQGIVSRVLYAALVTVVAVLITSRLTKVSEKYKE